MYQFWLGGILLPVSPEKVTITTGSQNQIYSLANGDEINILQKPKLKTIKFDALIPYKEYPFSHYTNNTFVDGDELRENIEALKENNTVFQFVITRQRGKKVYHYTDMRCSLEEISVIESSENGFDVIMSLTLRQYREFGARFVTEEKTAVRQQDNAPSAGSYTIAEGDSLWKIAKKYYNDGTSWRKIYEANKDKITNPNNIKKGTVITIP